MDLPRSVLILFAAGAATGCFSLATLHAAVPASPCLPPGLSAADWAGLRAAFTQQRHAVVPAAGGHQARNPGQRWRTRFDGSGFLTCPEPADWRWGLALQRYGFAGHERTVAESPTVTAVGAQVAYDWDAHVQEWFRNEPRGLEHGFTLRQRPPTTGPHAPLHFWLAVRGTLRASVPAGGRTVNFVDALGNVVVRYAGLTVFDAEGRALTARFEAVSEGLLLIVDERDARYPVTIDPIAQQAWFKADDAAVDDAFGWSVAVAGDTVLIGAPGEDSAALGVNGDATDASAPDAGAAYVFVRQGTNWTPQAYLKASNTGAGSFFGNAVALSGDLAVIGSDGEASHATGINGQQNDNSAPFSGAAYVFVRQGTNWTQQAYLKASNAEESDIFGYAVAVAGETVAVAAFGEDSQATGINGDQYDNSAMRSGAAYVFVRQGTNWTQQAYVKASNAEAFDSFGTALALAGNTLVVGAPFESGGAPGVNSNAGDNRSLNAGAAYVFQRQGTNWTQQAYLKATNAEADDYFGFAVAVTSDCVVVGAPQESSSATGINGPQQNNGAFNSGAAYVFARQGTNWWQQAYLKASNARPLDQFGWAVATSGNLAVIGAWQESSLAAGAGAAYLFNRSGTNWNEQARLQASNGSAADQFGWAVALSGDRAVVGANAEDSRAATAGAGYLFTFVSRLGIAPGGDGGYLLRFDGFPGRSYRLQRTIGLDGPWVNGVLRTMPAAGVLEFQDLFPPPGRAFYRVVQP